MSANTDQQKPVHGNYHSGKSVLDIGCNEGWVSCEIAQQRGASRVLGVDIDETLINAARRHLRLAWSLQAPSSTGSSDRSPNPPIESPPKKRRRKHRDADVVPADASRPRSALPPLLTPEDAHYFPTSMQVMFGNIPFPSTPSEARPSTFPHNITFEMADWVAEVQQSTDEKYDVVLALSITKWIHLNHGDEGLLSFFTKIFNSLHAGRGRNCYAKARKMDKRLRENAQRLKLRPENFEDELVKIGFRRPVQLGTVGEGGLRRRVDVYEKP
ncbi:Bicoid-interacting protein 3-domain-containing protein [Cantharellus anzutake]|uniref:Bicoid-interacting protein 3-domain-containing protein n=1 Tax=Cantharellus anzutake TaxID=1750568 RepID=UPI0019076C5D|nr:Bicoid-interacting protein 3-domain-containing protein [Cantharellus anzutake]KAF8324338.1 Bicoid-interacting protein 3-domain-containing protein [Cantharellus anzutake]